MESFRLPRFQRHPQNVAGIQLTPRDKEIIRAVSEHRFLRSSHIISLTKGSPQQILRRLQLLYHHGYLDRPKSQIVYYHQGGSNSMVYGLGSKGVKFLSAGSVKRPRRLGWTNGNRSVKQLYLEHALLISEVMVALEKSCSPSGIHRFVPENELAATIDLRDPFHWAATVCSQRVGLRPDRTFGLENRMTGERVLYFLEADRGTMPVLRKNFKQASFYRKLLS